MIFWNHQITINLSKGQVIYNKSLDIQTHKRFNRKNPGCLNNRDSLLFLLPFRQLN